MVYVFEKVTLGFSHCEYVYERTREEEEISGETPIMFQCVGISGFLLRGAMKKDL